MQHRSLSALDLASEAARRSVSYERRRALPVLVKPRKLNVWSFMKESIGKDLSRVSTPITFNEPLSMLQRFCEDLEYAQLLVKAESVQDSCLRTAFIACFVISQYSSSANRQCKPFNPLLGETFDFKQEEEGGWGEEEGKGGRWRWVSEQVSHHPPISACYADSPIFEYFGQYEPKNKFTGKDMEVTPRGTLHIKLKKWNEEYTFTKATSSLHNLIVGKMYVDNHGTVYVKNHCSGEQAKITLMKKGGWFGDRAHEVQASITTAGGEERYKLHGKWTEEVVLEDVQAQTREVVWTRHELPPNHVEMYHFSRFGITLNEITEEMRDSLPPTDCRFRPDQRLYENGEVKAAAKEKLRLEDKQRKARKQRESAGEKWTPRWFELKENSTTCKEEWTYKGTYWNVRETRQYEDLPDIF
uniref:Oxysterol-binding protein n=1 Tax=Palpitomonas bilix TaxID=652834 RepID=A0A7S3CWL2_9EUKA